MSAPLRICVIASSRFPVREPFIGGLEAHTHALVSALKRRGHDVSVFAAPGSDPGLGVTEIPAAALPDSFEVRHDVDESPEVWMQEHHAYLGLMLALAAGEHGRFDVVHNNSLHHLPVAMSSTLVAPMVTTLHTPPFPWLESAAAFAAPSSRFVAVSRQVAHAWGAVVEAETIHNGVDTDFWQPGPGGGRAVWFGRIVPEKAPHEALEAAALAGIGLDVIGPVLDDAYFRERVEPLLRDGARHLGHLSSGPLREAVGAASVAVVTPRWDEPFGLVAAEALACGTPVAAYDSGALGEILDPSSGVLVPAGDVGALAAAMLAAARLDRRCARRRAVEQFGHERMVECYEQTYRELSAPRRAA